MKAPHTTSAEPTVAVLALRAADQAANLTETLASFRALEYFITPTVRNDCERLVPTRSEMGALLRVLNDELERQIEAMARATDDLRNVREVAP